MTAPLLKIDYLSPLPPVRSGISDYSLDLLPFLAERADVRVVRLPEQPVSESVVDAWHPLAAEVWQLQPLAQRLPLYQMGNNPYHQQIERLAMRRPGVLTLHDVVLHHYLLGRTLGEDNYDPYQRRLAKDHGWIGDLAARPFRWRAFGNASQFSLPAHRRLLQRQRGILVHSNWARETILEENPELSVFTVRMGIPPVAEVDADRGAVFRSQWGIPQDAFLLGSFGFQTPMKRPLEVMRAMHQPGLQGVHLLIAGEVAPTLDLKRQMHQLDLAGRVHVTGFLDFADFEAAIAASNLALNLRYPSAGETSASLLRVLAVGKAAVTSEYAQFAELPDEVGVKVPVGEGEVEALAAAVLELAAQPERVREMEQRARDYVAREHRLEDAAAEIVAACDEISRTPAKVSKSVTQPIQTSITAHQLSGVIEVRGADRPWAEGEMREIQVELTNTGRASWLTESGAGQVQVRVGVRQGDRDLLAYRRPIQVQERIDTKQKVVVSSRVRRPVGPAQLEVELLVVGGDEVHRPKWVESI